MKTAFLSLSLVLFAAAAAPTPAHADKVADTVKEIERTLGACGVHEPRLRAFAAEAGFDDVRRLPVDDAFHHLYLLGA